MDLSTTYLGMRLPCPLIPGASPLGDDLDMVRQLEDAGAAAIVLRSLFEEQLVAEKVGAGRRLDGGLAPDRYLEHLRRVKRAIGIPVIASLNGAWPGDWLDFAKLQHQAGADAIELSVCSVATDPAVSAADVEQSVVDMLAEIEHRLPIPVAVKLSPFYSALPHFARRLDEAGADGLVLFHRSYEQDIDTERLAVEHRLRLSTAGELLLRLRWLAVLSGRVDCSLAVSGGVHGALDAIKAVMAGAHAVQLVSTLLRHGPASLTRMLADMSRWLAQHEYASLDSMRGSMSLVRCPDPRAHARANFLEMIGGRGG